MMRPGTVAADGATSSRFSGSPGSQLTAAGEILQNLAAFAILPPLRAVNEAAQLIARLHAR